MSIKIANIDFPDALLNALRNRNLVVFAGAGVSMGEPAYLPNFKTLAEDIAQGTGETLQNNEPEDRFLGKLHHRGVQVHAIAVQKLQTNRYGKRPQPTDLHRDLLRLSSTPESPRIITTNFDLLFKEAAKEVFDPEPEMFRAPALPSGRDFNGIVHVHGALDRPAGMVLTDADFGRAYLTEGWTRRFLVELFRSLPVLFVGYSHNDTILTYLARALPESETGRRFALTDEAEHDRWQRLGIEAITYSKPSDDDHSALTTGIRGLAKHATRGVLDWQREITALARKPPHLNEEETGLIEEALKDEDATKTRFFTDAASSPEWIAWLDRHGHLDGLFGTGEFRDQDTQLALWLAKQFALTHTHAGELFLLISRHDMRLHPDFWRELGRTISSPDNAPPPPVLSRWISLLLATVPAPTDHWILCQLGERCAEAGLMDDLVEVFDTMADERLMLRTRLSGLADEDEDPYSRIDVEVSPPRRDSPWIGHLWKKGLKPDLEHFAEVLLGRIVARLRVRHHTFCTWGRAARDFDPESWRRSAIEPHKQDRHRKSIDVLIDAARDCLEWLASNRPETAAQWCERLVNAEAPLLRRLAIHTLSVRGDLIPNGKVDWLLAHTDLHDPSAHHEMFRIMHSAYPATDSAQRRAVIAAIRAYRAPDQKNTEIATAYQHFRWFHWLHGADPNCTLVDQALGSIQERYPAFQPREHPDLTGWVSRVKQVTLPRPWSVEELLSRPAVAWLDEFLSFQPTASSDFPGLDRSGLRLTVAEAAGQKFSWGLDLADALINAGEWKTDLWTALLRTWSEAKLDDAQCQQVLQRLSKSELQAAHVRPIADFLCNIAESSHRQEVRKSLALAEKLANALWDHLDRCEAIKGGGNDWLTHAISHPAGMLTKFWLQSLSLWRNRQAPAPHTLNDEYRAVLSKIVQDESDIGRLGRAVLARCTAFLLGADENWTKQHLLPLFENRDDLSEYSAVWDGLLYGQVNLQVREVMGQAFLEAASHMQAALSEAALLDRFVEMYAAVIFLHVEDPLKKWIPAFFKDPSEEGRRHFAFSIGGHLRAVDKTQQRDCWKRWLGSYWKNRLNGVPKPLNDQEIESMLDNWLPNLGAVFPEAVDVAIRMPTTQTSDNLVIHHIAESDFPQTHPEAVAKLLIHLGDCGPLNSFRDEIKAVISTLLQSNLSSNLEQTLKELMATNSLN